MRGTSRGKCCFSPCDSIHFFGTRQHLSACCTSLPGCPASAPASRMSNSELIIFLCKLMLIFLCSLFLLKHQYPPCHLPWKLRSHYYCFHLSSQSQLITLTINSASTAFLPFVPPFTFLLPV